MEEISTTENLSSRTIKISNVVVQIIERHRIVKETSSIVVMMKTKRTTTTRPHPSVDIVDISLYLIVASLHWVVIVISLVSTASKAMIYVALHVIISSYKLSTLCKQSDYDSQVRPKI